MLSLLMPVALFAPSLRASAVASCKEVAFTVAGSAHNRNISTVPFNDLQALTSTFEANNFTTFPVSASQTIAAWYCEPKDPGKNGGKLQVLNSPITENREYWTALGGTGLVSPPREAYNPSEYSWVDYANREGYATLAFDRLGSGKSSHPDPAILAQDFYERELYHDMVKQIRTDKSNPLSRTFQHLIYIGSSYGSSMGSTIVATYPEDFEEMILTGYSKAVLPSLPGVTAMNATPASQVDAKAFGDLAAGYLTTPNQTTRTNSFFGDPDVVDFEPQVAELFFQRKDVVSSGQFVSVYVGIVAAPAYRGRVLILTGEEDQAYCGPGSSAINKSPSCGDLLKESKELFPNAEYNWKSVPRTGHALHLHKSAPSSMKMAHDFLEGKRCGV